MIEQKFVERIAGELAVKPEQVAKAVELLEGGATIPFIARYRKDVTQNLDEEQLESVCQRNAYFISLTDRRAFVLKEIEKQGKLTDALREEITACEDKSRLEDLYLPYKRKRRTKASVAAEQGLEPLADAIWEQSAGAAPLRDLAAAHVNAEGDIKTPEQAIEGAGHILAERVSVDPGYRSWLRDFAMKSGALSAKPTKNSEGQKTKYESYYDFSEPLAKIPSHRFFAVMRGVKDGLLRMEIAFDDQAVLAEGARRFIKQEGSPYEPLLKAIIEDAYYRLMRPSMENEVLGIVRERCDEEAIRVFRENAENLLLSPPAGPITVVGADPGVKTGVKLAVVNAQGDFVESAVAYLAGSEEQRVQAEEVLLGLIDKHGAKAVAIGNGTGSREAAAFIRKTLTKRKESGVFSVLVNEAGASVYSASKVAREEFPDLDVTERGAISIARRLQDPLAELVKIEPRHVGVGQYQHDVNQKLLRDGLQRTVASCVNRVGVDLKTASAPLLRYVSGVQADTAKNLVAFRSEKGGFESREQLLEVNGVGPRVFEQCAGFMRLAGGGNPLDATGIHPEAYGIVEAMAGALNMALQDLVANPEPVKELDLSQFKTEVIGDLTLNDIRNELLKPGRDPRTEFKAPQFLDGVDSVQQLEEGMESEGVVTNVTDFGAFVDIGVHQDGLVHLSELSRSFVRDPRDVVKVGEIVKVKVIKVEKDLPRISLSIKALLPEQPRKPRAPRPAASAQGPPRKEGEGGEGPPQQQRARRPEGDRQQRHQQGERRQGQGKPQRKRRKPDKRRDKQRQPAKSSDSGSKEPINTLLADQLADFLKDDEKT